MKKKKRLSDRWQLVGLLRMAYQARDPFMTLFHHQLIERGFPAQELDLTGKLCNVDDDDDNKHPQSQIIKDFKEMEATYKERDEIEGVSYESGFIYFVTSFVTFCGEFVFPYVNRNAPLSYIWLHVHSRGTAISLKSHTFDGVTLPFRVRLNRLVTYAFNLNTGSKVQSPRGVCARVTATRKGKLKMTQPLEAFDCVVILTFKKLKKVYYNDGPNNVLWELPYLEL